MGGTRSCGGNQNPQGVALDRARDRRSLSLAGVRGRYPKGRRRAFAQRKRGAAPGALAPSTRPAGTRPETGGEWRGERSAQEASRPCPAGSVLRQEAGLFRAGQTAAVAEQGDTHRQFYKGLLQVRRMGWLLNDRSDAEMAFGPLRGYIRAHFDGVLGGGKRRLLRRFRYGIGPFGQVFRIKSGRKALHQKLNPRRNRHIRRNSASLKGRCFGMHREGQQRKESHKKLQPDGTTKLSVHEIHQKQLGAV